ncbi:hypothetical protein F2P56_011921 [Juglans regia]|uniref:MRN complex-interacting protein n=2 Tax=Juglans regia TaxID=51240 RepID=A0A2I4GWC0_JUGRE|nr:MRN complex-interacting protein [Juglans regia]KAF5467690.1 hypothetical protein F2P56_011921 [Juglans regia]
MSTIFIAVQCCQCSTMQVKQQHKKKSKIVNKWTCVVCNQRQSIRKVFAQGFMAKDLRHFVQTFNMSRKFSDHQPTNLHGTPLPESQQVEEEDITNDGSPCGHRKRRSNWSEYLDSERDDRIEGELEATEEELGGGFEPKIVTELPEGMFKKPKLKNSFVVVDAGEGESDVLYKPVFSKRNSSSKRFISQDKELSCRPRMTASSSSKGNEYMRQDEDKPRRKVQLPMATAARVSKWNDYMTTHDDTKLELASGTNIEEHHGSQWSDDILELETITHDQRVEDDVHPDFMC